MSSMQKGIRQQGQHPTRQRITVIKNCKLKVWKFQKVKKVMPEGMCKPHYGNQDFSPLTNGIYFIVMIKKTPLQTPLPKRE